MREEKKQETLSKEQPTGETKPADRNKEVDDKELDQASGGALDVPRRADKQVKIALELGEEA